MKKVFVDANVIITVLNREYPKFRLSGRILSLSENPNYTICTSATSLAITYYFACKQCSEEKAFEKMRMLCKWIEVTDSGSKEVMATLANKKVMDFEDGIEHYSAIHAGCDYIVTDDLDDFYFAEIPVMNCEDFLRNIVLPELGPKPKQGYKFRKT